MSKPAIICVDDEMFVLSSLKAELKSTFGDEYLIETAEGSFEALEILDELLKENCDVPVVIADYIMPDMKGDELLKRIHEISPKTLKIMLTGQANPDAIGNAVNDAKLYRYIPKPWEPEDLVLTIQEAIKSYYQDRQLEVQHQRLLEMNQTLEQKVAERTKELSSALDELQNMQLQLVHAEKMAAIGNLVAGIAHEVNNPIGVVKSSADISDRCLKKIENYIDKADESGCLKSDDQYIKTMEILKSNNTIITQASDRVSRLVKSLKSFTRLDEAEMQAVDIHESLDNTLGLVKGELGKVKIVKEYGILPNVPCYVNQLNQAFMSLLLFSIQNMQHEGTLTISTELFKIAGKKEKSEHAKICISDSGKSLSTEQLNTLFDLGFYTKDSRIQLRTELSIAYNVILKHEGQITVKSLPEKGNIFTLLLPLYHQIT